MNERKPTWNCPVCDKPALYEKLVIDGYVLIDAVLRFYLSLSLSLSVDRKRDKNRSGNKCIWTWLDFMYFSFLSFRSCVCGVVFMSLYSSYFQDVLQSSLLPPDINEILLLKDGSWATQDNNADANCLDTPRKSTHKVEVISDDIGTAKKFFVSKLDFVVEFELNCFVGSSSSSSSKKNWFNRSNHSRWFTEIKY